MPEVLRLEKLLKKFHDRYQDLIEKYHKSVKEMVNDSFPEIVAHVSYILQDLSHAFIALHGFVIWIWQIFFDC